MVIGREDSGGSVRKTCWESTELALRYMIHDMRHQHREGMKEGVSPWVLVVLSLGRMRGVGGAVVDGDSLTKEGKSVACPPHTGFTMLSSFGSLQFMEMREGEVPHE
jgi:hypothetical protein